MLPDYYIAQLFKNKPNFTEDKSSQVKFLMTFRIIAGQDHTVFFVFIYRNPTSSLGYNTSIFKDLVLRMILGLNTADMIKINTKYIQ